MDLGGFFLAGLPLNGIQLNMPFAEILVSLALSLGITPDPLFILIHMCVYALVFFTGCLLRGYWAGILALLAAGFFGGGSELIYEQAIYSYFLLLTLGFLLRQRSEKTLSNSLLCGLALSSSMLVRTPLFLFAPVVIFCSRPGSGERLTTFLRRALLFLAASYILLLPWGFMNYSVTGKFMLLDQQRSSNNVLSAAMGSIYSIYGDTWKMAGLTGKTSAVDFYRSEVMKRPFFHAHMILKRLWHIFLFYPVLLTLLIIAIARSREREKALLFCLPVYFVLIHSPLSLEIRYFYPLTYLLPPLLAGTFLPRRFDVFPEARHLAGKAVSWAFWLSFAAVLCVEALVLAYPWRSARSVPSPDTYALASERFPGDRKLYAMKCTELWINGSDEKYRKCLGEYSLKFRDKVKSYFLAVRDSRSPSDIPFPPRNEIQADIVFYYTVKMLREFELGSRDAALASLKQANLELNPPLPASSSDWQHKEPYRNDKELRDLLKQDTSWFWDSFVYETLRLWPPERMRKILSEISGSFPLTPRLIRLADMLRDVRSAGAADIQLRKQIRDDLYGTRLPGFAQPDNGGRRR